MDYIQALSLSVFLLLLLAGNAALADLQKGETTHFKSKITVISDDFTVPKVSFSMDADSHIETATLRHNNGNVGFVRFHFSKRNTYCGFDISARYVFIKPGGNLEKYSLSFGGPSFDSEVKGKQGGNGRYITYKEGAGEKFFCVVSTTFTRSGGSCGGGGGRELTHSLVCIPKNSSETGTLADKVIKMLSNLKTNGTGKELIK